jgi:hypothetical protein
MKKLKRSEVTKSHLTMSFLSIDLLDGAPCQPHSRETDTALLSLRKIIERDGHIKKALDVVPDRSRYTIADGHRRVTISRALGFLKVPCVIHHGVSVSEIPDLWADLNRTKTVNAQQWAEMWFRSDGSADSRMPPGPKNNLAACIRIWGHGHFRSLVLERGVSPSVVHVLQQIRIRVEQCPSVGKVTEKEIGNWLIDFKMQNTVNSIFNGSMRVPHAVLKKIVSCIKNGRPFNPFG